MHRLPAYTSSGENNTEWDTEQAMENSWCRYTPINSEKLLCIVDNYSTFPVMSRADWLSEDDLIKSTEAVFVEFELSKNIVSDAGRNFILDWFKHFSGSWT